MVTQRRTGFPFGDCVRTAYSVLLGIDYENIPDFDPGHLNGAKQGDREREWLASIGFDMVEISTAPDSHLSQEVLDCMPEVPHLMSGISPRGFGHRCVGIGGKLVFDPHPSRAGLLNVYSVALIVPLAQSADDGDDEW